MYPFRHDTEAYELDKLTIEMGHDSQCHQNRTELARSQLKRHVTKWSNAFTTEGVHTFMHEKLG